MKISAVVISVLFFLFSLSCEESLKIPEFSDGVNLRIQFTEGKSYFDFSDLSNAEIEYSVFTENTNIESVEIGLTIIPDGNTVFDRIVIETFTLEDFIDGSLTKSLRGQEMARLIGYTGINDFEGGELFNFDVVVTLTNGRIYPDLTVNTPDTKVDNTNVSPNIQQAVTASFTQSFSTFVGCPTEMVPGIYVGNATNSAVPCTEDPFGGSHLLKANKEVELKQIGIVSWNISDVAREFYHGIAIDLRNQPVQLFDVCNMLRSFGSQGSIFNISASGIHDPISHQIDLQWVDNHNMYISTMCENTYLPQ